VAIEGHHSAFKPRFNAMKSLHSEEKSPIIIRGAVIDYNFVEVSPSLVDMTPAEAALNKKPIDGVRSWLWLLKLAVEYKNLVGGKKPKPKDLLDYNFVNPSPAQSNMTPTETAQNKKPIDGKHSWLTPTLYSFIGGMSPTRNEKEIQR